MEEFNLDRLERETIIRALDKAGHLLGAARLLGITRHSLKRRIVKHRIEWPAASVVPAPAPETIDSGKGRAACT